MIRQLSRHIVLASVLILTLMCGNACSVDKYVEEGDYHLKKVNISYKESKEDDSSMGLRQYVKQNPNTSWFGAKVPLRIYCLSSPQKATGMSKLLRKIGEAPVIYDSLQTDASVQDMQRVLGNAGYMHAQITTTKKTKGKSLTLIYNIDKGERYVINHINREIEDDGLRTIICGGDTAVSLLHSGDPLNINTLNSERSRIMNLLQGMGYYKFNKDYISYRADTIAGSSDVDLTLQIRLHMENGRSEPTPHRQYRIGDVNFLQDITSVEEATDSIDYKGARIFYKDQLHFRPSMFTSNSLLHSGELFSNVKMRQTLGNFNRLGAVGYSASRMQQRGETDILDCFMMVNRGYPHSLSLDIEGTNTAGDLGAAASVSYNHKNLFKGSEMLTIKLRGAYEAITGLEGYEGRNYTEMGGEMKLAFPGFLLPFVKQDFGISHRATSEISLQYNRQNRPEFNRRVLTASWRYKWQTNEGHVNHRFDLLEINYINMPWISDRFKEQYLDSLGKQNAILRYNYENLLITKLGYTYTYNSLGSNAITTYGQNAWVLKANIETSGNVLSVLTKALDTKTNDQGQRTFCGIAFAQYVRGDLDYSKSFRIDNNNSVAIHAAFGIAIPYGNSNLVPFEKRYFAGGANSLRGWSVRSLGPGAYKGADKQINFLNQSGDVKLDMSIEFRSHLFWKINGALFVDGGNIWTIRKYEDQPEGEFKIDKFYKQLAMSYGLGLRVVLDFFTLRFDMGMKGINPAYTGRDHWPLLHPKLKRDFAFHFAVGLPF